MKSCSSERIGVRQYNKSEFPRLRWTPALHRYFVQTVEVLGGRNQATPKRILQMMGVKGLKISHIKSHLQMYRSMKLEHGSSCEHVMMKQAMKQTRRRTLHSSDIKIFLSSVSSSSGILREEEELNRSNREHDSSSNIKETIISQQDSDSCLESRMSEEECIDGSMLEDQTCELSLSLKPTHSSITQQILQTQLQLCPSIPHQHPITSPNFVKLNEFPHPHHINLDLTI